MLCVSYRRSSGKISIYQEGLATIREPIAPSFSPDWQGISTIGNSGKFVPFAQRSSNQSLHIGTQHHPSSRKTSGSLAVQHGILMTSRHRSGRLSLRFGGAFFLQISPPLIACTRPSNPRVIVVSLCKHHHEPATKHGTETRGSALFRHQSMTASGRLRSHSAQLRPNPCRRCLVTLEHSHDPRAIITDLVAAGTRNL